MDKVRTRFAPSPTGFMHIGNLRTALYSFLFARHEGGEFILRIEDTDSKRYVEGAVDAIYNTLSMAGIAHDEGPDKEGSVGPYVQSKRGDLYKKYAKKLVESGHAYYCFCNKEEEAPLTQEDSERTGYNRKCRNLSKEEIEKNLREGMPYVIRQKVPLEGSTSYTDAVYGKVSIENSEMDDMVLLKSDGMATYNFANVVDDHLMGMTHILRGADFISSTPKYVLLYNAFGWEIPTFIHLPLIMGQNEDGTVSKLSKRHGATSFEQLVNLGYDPKAIVNYIALLGWSSEDNREILSMEELIQEFSVKRVSKSSSIFDYNKLAWLSGEYLKEMPLEEFDKKAHAFAGELPTNIEASWSKVAKLLHGRTDYFSEVEEKIAFLKELKDFPEEYYENKKNKTNALMAKELLPQIKEVLEGLTEWNNDNLFLALGTLAQEKEIKKGALMWIARIAVSGETATPGGATEIMEVLGKQETILRLQKSIDALK